MFDAGLTAPVDWHYPSRLDCMTCHTPTGGSTLGPSTAQINRTKPEQGRLRVGIRPPDVAALPGQKHERTAASY
jgi:hypothetical protein